MDILILVASLAVILLGCELFTNGIEWIGNKLNLGEGVVGSVLAAVGTAMPETLIPIIAIFFSGASSEQVAHEIGIGAILGAPFMLATLAMFVTGTAILIFTRTGRRTSQMNVNPVVLGRDMTFFFIAYTIAFGVAFLPQDGFFQPQGVVRWVVAASLIVLYAVYVLRQFSDETEIGDDLNPLHIARFFRSLARKIGLTPASGMATPVVEAHTAVDVQSMDEISPILRTPPSLMVTIFQATAGLALIIVGARMFVDSVDHLGHAIGIAPLILALLIAPVATELPEKFNSVLWVRRGKDTLAMGNITGAMVFQSCIPTAIGIALTGWTFSATPESTYAFISAPVALISAGIIFGVMRLRGNLTAKWLLFGGAWYAAFLVFIITRSIGG
ncbi:MAG: sodium:calcium antiporter [Dehalococcoidia bacterium]|nr:sodium:calcium antiporter [Dehalococcoidia bacterium]